MQAGPTVPSRDFLGQEEDVSGYYGDRDINLDSLGLENILSGPSKQTISSVVLFKHMRNVCKLSLKGKCTLPVYKFVFFLKGSKGVHLQYGDSKLSPWTMHES